MRTLKIIRQLQLKSEYHPNDPLRAYVYVLCLSPTELYISDHI